jgi:hypothetical protein
VPDKLQSDGKTELKTEGKYFAAGDFPAGKVSTPGGVILRLMAAGHDKFFSWQVGRLEPEVRTRTSDIGNLELTSEIGSESDIRCRRSVVGESVSR